MSFINITALNFPEGMEKQVEESFRHRKQAVDREEGFLSFQLLRPVKGESRYFVCTTWETREDFDRWMTVRAANKADEQAQQRHPGMSVDVMEFETVELS
ncbi:antibiotic biosynthesis monooxygenase family protein [Corynebacterium halotolerans]|uniref:antibiotic biosynthesis monooxygenase family protein n=1 Tax=Corynebacterium halotolerans TaxID=225326 RepID=UPI003CF7623A